MRLRYFILTAFSWSLFFVANAQTRVQQYTNHTSTPVSAAQHSEVTTVSSSGVFRVDELNDKKWNVTYSHLGFPHGNEQSTSKLDSIKSLQAAVRQSKDRTLANQGAQDGKTANKKDVIEPVLGQNLQGNNMVGMVPPDNNIAVSDQGDFVSVSNTTIVFGKAGSSSITESYFSTFFGSLGLSGKYFDPKVIFDPSRDRFIVVCLSGNTPYTSRIAVAFSLSSNPQGAWSFYAFNGNPLNNNTWFDFPTIGISTEELYIAGNSFDANGSFSQTMIYQIEKNPAYSGQSINSMYWYSVKDANGWLDFNVVPMSYGFDGTLEPGMYFVSSESFGGSEVMLYQTTGTIKQKPSLNAYRVSTGSYGVAGDGEQMGTFNMMKTNDCRVQSGFYTDGKVHFVMNTSRNGYSGLYYGRINIDNNTCVSETFGLDGYDYAYPSIAPFSIENKEPTVLISFLRTGSSIYPEFRAVTCNSSGEWSPSISVKQGDQYVSYSSGTEQRWGDYTGIARRHLSSGIEVWVSGCYGTRYQNGYSNTLSTWIGQIRNSSSGGNEGQKPIADFGASQTTVNTGQAVTLFDQSLNNPTSWSWSFPGANPSSSTEQNPTISYYNEGVFSVSLTATNANGTDFINKTGFIVVSNKTGSYQVDFTADRTEVAVGDYVQFTDRSQIAPYSWSWVFPGGYPSYSYEANPRINYGMYGVFPVGLTITDFWNSYTAEKVNYIYVGVSSLEENIDPLNDFQVFPNPSPNGLISVKFELEKSDELDFYVIDQLGNNVKHLLRHRAKAGENMIQFNGEMLSKGVYSVIVKDIHQRVLKRESLVIL